MSDDQNNFDNTDPIGDSFSRLKPREPGANYDPTPATKPEFIPIEYPDKAAEVARVLTFAENNRQSLYLVDLFSKRHISQLNQLIDAYEVSAFTKEDAQNLQNILNFIEGPRAGESTAKLYPGISLYYAMDVFKQLYCIAINLQDSPEDFRKLFTNELRSHIANAHDLNEERDVLELKIASLRAYTNALANVFVALQDKLVNTDPAGFKKFLKTQTEIASGISDLIIFAQEGDKKSTDLLWKEFRLKPSDQVLDYYQTLFDELSAESERVNLLGDEPIKPGDKDLGGFIVFRKDES